MRISMTKTLKTPHQWMAEEGTYVHNNGVWREGIRTEYVPIDHETYRRIVMPLTRMFNLTPIPETVGVDELREHIQTKIEEVREDVQAEINDVGQVFMEDHQFDLGMIQGLELVLGMLEELSVL
jgi:hypothetical protein